jgi:hypothetical protein
MSPKLTNTLVVRVAFLSGTLCITTVHLKYKTVSCHVRNKTKLSVRYEGEWWRRCKDQQILNLGIRWTWVFSRG